MITKPFRVGYIGAPAYESFIDVLQATRGIEIVHMDKRAPDELITKTLASCHGYYVSASRQELPRAWHVTSELLAKTPLMLMVASYGSGFDTIDVEACTAAGVAAVNQAGGNAQAVAEHAVGMMLALCKRIPEASAAMRAGTVVRREALMARELAGRTVGIVGLGHCGRRTAALVQAFGCRVLAFDPYLDAPACAAAGATKIELLVDLLSASDVVSLHCPLNDETRGLFNADKFTQMQPGAIFINTSRGGTYDEAALQGALASGHLAGAGLDVWEQEPPPKDHPLLGNPAVIASPHTAGITHESRDRVARLAAEAFVSVAAGRLPPRLLNPEVAEQFRMRLAAMRGR